MEPSFWRERWITGQTGWDTGGPHRLLDALLEAAREARLLPHGARILEPGCGRAHNGAKLAVAGYNVVSFDVTAEAISAARGLYEADPRLTLAVADALNPPEEWNDQFDAVFDRAMLCALPPELRRAYVEACFRCLKPGGAFLSLPFVEVFHPDGRLGPPFGVPMRELAALLMPGFSLCSAEESRTPEPTDRIRREAVAVWRRRPRWLVEGHARDL